MAKTSKLCRICGKKYEPCKASGTITTFRWQDVSCSQECGSEYLQKIQLSRGAKIKKLNTRAKKEPFKLKEEIVEDIYIESE